MSSRSARLSELVDRNVLEIGAGRPRSEAAYLPVLRVADVLDGHVQLTVEPDGPTSHRPDAGPKASRPGDIVLTTKGTVGRVAIMPSGGPTYAYSPQLCYFRSLDGDSLAPRYLYYWFKSGEFWTQADAVKAQTDMADFISLQDVFSLRMGLPAIEEQKAIAEVLGALDDKIASNARLASLVDELLATRFARLADGRESVGLKNIATVNQRPTRPQAGGMLRYLDISSVGRGTYDLPPETKWEDAPGRARRLVAHGDVVWSTVRPNRRSHALVLDKDDKLVGSTALAVLTPAPGRTAGLYEATRTDRFVAYLETVAEGSAYPAVRAERFLEAPIPELDPSEWDQFEELALPLRELAQAMTIESRRLADTRDGLLPLLMSGKVRVKDAENSAEGVL